MAAKLEEIERIVAQAAEIGKEIDTLQRGRTRHWDRDSVSKKVAFCEAMAAHCEAMTAQLEEIKFRVTDPSAADPNNSGVGSVKETGSTPCADTRALSALPISSY
jgi:hypothetical protein